MSAVNQIDQQQVSEVVTGGIPDGEDGGDIAQGFKGCVQVCGRVGIWEMT